MRILSRLGIAVLLALAAYGGACVGKALHGPFADEIRRTHWRGAGPIACYGGGEIELRGETVDVAASLPLEAWNGCDVVLVDCDLRAPTVATAPTASAAQTAPTVPTVLKVVNHGHLTIERGSLHGLLELSNGGVTTIHDAHVDSIRMVNDGALTITGGSVEQIVAFNNDVLTLDGVDVKRLGIFNETKVSLHGGTVDQLVMFNHGELVAENAAVGDLDVHNDTRVTMRGGTYGFAYIWNGARAEILGSTVAHLEDDPRGDVNVTGGHVTRETDGSFWARGAVARVAKQSWVTP